MAIYKITNIENNKIYIGSTTNCKKREKRHFSMMIHNRHPNSHIQNSFNKHGKDFFQFSIIEEVLDKEKLIEKEQYWIDLLKPEFNLSPTAGNCLGCKRSEETKKILRDKLIGIKLPQWRKDLIRQTTPRGDDHWARRVGFSQQHKERMSDAQKNLRAKGVLHPRSLTIIQYSLENEYISEYLNSVIAGKETGLSAKAIRKAASNRSKTSGGFIWKYKKDQ